MYVCEFLLIVYLVNVEGVPYCLEFQQVGQVLGYMAVYFVEWFNILGFT